MLAGCWQAPRVGQRRGRTGSPRLPYSWDSSIWRRRRTASTSGGSMLDGGADDGVVGVEATVCQVAGHAHDVLLVDAWLRAIVGHWRQDPGLA